MDPARLVGGLPGVEEGDAELQGGEVAHPLGRAGAPTTHRVHQEEPTSYIYISIPIQLHIMHVYLLHPGGRTGPG